MEIGQTILDEEPGKIQQFFTDPKNLATILVLAAAAAGPRSRGSTALHHGLKSGVGALAFRGGLDQGIQQQQMAQQEAQSVQTARRRQADQGDERNRVAGEQVMVAREGNQIRRDVSINDNKEATNRLNARLAADQALVAAQMRNRADIAANTNQTRLDIADRQDLSSNAQHQELMNLKNNPLPAEDFTKMAFQGWMEDKAAWQALGGAASNQPEPELETYLAKAQRAMAIRNGIISIEPPPPTDPKAQPVRVAGQQKEKGISVVQRKLAMSKFKDVFGYKPGDELTINQVEEDVLAYENGILEKLRANELPEGEIKFLLKERGRLLSTSTKAELQRALRGRPKTLTVKDEKGDFFDKMTEVILKP